MSRKIELEEELRDLRRELDDAECEVDRIDDETGYIQSEIDDLEDDLIGLMGEREELVKELQRYLSVTTPKVRLLTDMEQAIAEEKLIYALHFELPNGAKETHVVSNGDIAAKRTFVANNYDDDLFHNNKSGVRIVTSGGFDTLDAMNELIIK